MDTQHSLPGKQRPKRTKQVINERIKAEIKRHGKLDIPEGVIRCNPGVHFMETIRACSKDKRADKSRKRLGSSA